MLSAAAMLMLSTPTMAQAQLDENSQAQAQVHELTPPESSADASPGLEGDNDLGQADEVAPPIPSDEELKAAMPDDADADDPDQLAQANQPDSGQPQQAIDEAGMPAADAAELEGEQTELKGRDLEPMPEPELNQQ